MVFSIEQVLNDWANFGVFAYLLPFLLIFAVVYGVLSKTNLLGDNKGVNATIAAAVGLLALQFDYVSNFFASILPYTGMAIVVLLVALILMGLITDTETPYTQWIWFGIGAVAFIIVLLTSMSDFAYLGWWGGGYSWGYAWPAVLAAIITIGLLVWIIASSGASKPKKEK